MIRQFEAFSGENFSGGLVTSNSPFELDENQSPNVMNCYSDIYKGLNSRKGYTAITSSETSGTNYGLYDFEVRSGDRKMLSLINTTLYKMENLDGTQDSLLTGLPADDMIYTEINRILVFKSWSPSSAYYWDGIEATPTSIPQFPIKGVNPIQWNQHIFYFTTDHEQNKLKYSDYNSYLLYDPGNFYYTTDGQVISGLETVRGRLVMFKPYGIDRVTYLGGIPLLEVKNVVNGVGTTSRQAVKKAHTRQFGEVLFFPTADNRIVMFNGYEIKFISDAINQRNDESPFELNQLHEAVAVVDSKRGWYICFFGDYGIVYDYNLNSWWPFDNQGFEACAYSAHGHNTDYLVVAAKDGHLYKWFDGDTDDGTDIEAYWDSPHISLGQPHMLKKGFSAGFNYKVTGNANLTFQKKLDFTKDFGDAMDMPLYPEGHEYFLGTTFELGSATLGSKRARSFNADIREEWNYFQYRIKKTTGRPFNLWRGSVYQKSAGLQVSKT